jgi:hypothetical protein
MVDKIHIWHTNSAGDERSSPFDTAETEINLDLRDITSVDLLPLVFSRNLRYLNIRDNLLSQIDLTPLSHCKKLESLRLSNNRLVSLNLSPLAECPLLQEVVLQGNLLTRLDISPLFHCPDLREFKVDATTALTADLLLRSIGSWPQLILDLFHKIRWEAPRIM